METIPEASLQKILEHCQKHSWENSVFSDVSLSSKKIFPGYIHRSPGLPEAWRARGKVTEDSIYLMVQHIITVFEETSADCRKKVSQQEVDIKSEEAAFVYNMAMEAKRECPLEDGLLKEKWFDPWVAGDFSCTMEVSNHLQRKVPDLTPRGVKQLAEVMNIHGSSMPVREPSSRPVDGESLEEDAWNLLKQRVQYDIQCFRITTTRMASWEASKYHEELMQRRQRWEVSNTAAESFLNCYVNIIHAEKSVEAVMRNINDFVDRSMKRFGLHKANLAIAFFLNWSAVSRCRDAFQSVQTQVAGILLNNDNNAIGVMLAPTFGYVKGQTYLAEHNCLKKLHQSGLNVDRTMSLQFAARSDARDTRPLIYQGRVATGVSMNEQKWFFRASSIVTHGRTENAEQLPASAMEQVEDVDPMALPSTTSDDHLSGAKKFEQIGQDAWVKLFDATLDGLEVGPNTSILIIDGNLAVGDSFSAYLETRKQYNCPIFYVGMTDDEVTKEWFLKTRCANLTLDHLEGKVEFPGVARVADEAPTLMPDKPTLQKLNVLVPAGPSGLSPCIPAKVMEEWSSHPRFSGEFQDLVEKIIAEFGPLIDEKDKNKGNGNKGKKEDTDNDNEKGKELKKRRVGKDAIAPAVKKVKVDGAFLKMIDAVGESNKLLEFELLNKGGAGSFCGISVHVKFGNKIWLFNRTKDQVTLQPGHLVAGFGAGGYKHRKDGEQHNVEKEVLFELSPSSLINVQGGNPLGYVSDVIQKQRASDPKAQIAYHKITEDPSPDDAAKLSITLEARVVFIPSATSVNEEGEEKDKGKAKSIIARAAALLPATAWKTHCTSVVWLARWAALGLTPVKPQVILTKEVVLEPGQACEL